MRCPKCHYISFDAGDRCRNCGYEFSLTVDVASLDLPIQTGEEAIGPFSDFALTDLDGPSTSGASAEAQLAPKRTSTAGFDLPLFKDRPVDDDAPLVTPSAVPRAPLAVRKSTPPVTRPTARARTEEPELDLGIPDSGTFRERAMADPEPIASAPEPEIDGVASLGRRLAAAAIDTLVLGLIDAAILYLTLRLCGLQFSELAVIPPVPFASFLLLQNGAYFVAFVAVGGQTVGKMALSIKVVPVGDDRSTDRVPLGTAVLRAAAWFLTVLPAGIGLLPALFSADGRAVHDRLAGTRVIRA
jgi:uncharacterized RDD family membrane protein YckC